MASIPKTIAAAVSTGLLAMAGVSPDAAQSNLSGWIEIFGLPPLNAILTPAVDKVVIVIAGAYLLYVFVNGTRRWWIKKGQQPPFDVPIREAVEHIVRTFPHSFDNSAGAERMALRALHEEMCKGRLPVIGSWGEGAAPRRIRARKCRKLEPLVGVIPSNPTTPDGKTFILADEAAMAMPNEHTEPTAFTGLRVRSRDLYYLWPQDCVEDREEIYSSPPKAARENLTNGYHVATQISKCSDIKMAREIYELFCAECGTTRKADVCAAFARVLSDHGECVWAAEILGDIPDECSELERTNAYDEFFHRSLEQVIGGKSETNA